MPEPNYYVVGADLGGTNVRAALVEESTGKIVCRSKNIPSMAQENADITAGQIAIAVEEAMAAPGIDRSLVRGVGIAVPGHVHPGEGKVLWAPNFKNRWKDVQLASLISARIDLPVHLGNDGNMAALGEYTFGVGKGKRHLAMITLGTGVGGGVIIDGRLLTGADGGAGEVGHMIVNPGGRGGFTSFGSVEGEAQRDAVCERAERKIQQGRKTTLAEIADFDRFRLTPAVIADAALAGDAVAVEVFEETGYYVGLCAANLINMFNPELVVIGGGLAGAGDLIMEPIRRTAFSCAVRTLSRSCEIVVADLGDNAGIYGAAALVMQQFDGIKTYVEKTPS